MMVFLLTLLLLPQQLTWYELYERGEKMYGQGNYTACISDMNAALALKGEAKKNQFTRAMMKIDYNPHYYVALAEYKQGRLGPAFEAARKALAGEVVRANPILQSDLAPILIDWQKQAESMHKRYVAEQAVTNKRAELMKLLAAGDLKTVGKLLAETGSDKAYEDIRIQWEMRQKLAGETASVQKELYDRVQGFLTAKNAVAAEAAFEMIKGNLPDDLRQALQEQVAQAKATQVNAKPMDQKEKAAVLKAEAELAAYKKSLEDVETKAKTLETELASMSEINQNMRIELAKDKTKDQPTLGLVPLVTFEQVGQRQIRAVGQVFSPRGLKSWSLHVGKQELALEPPGTPEGFSYKLDQVVTLADFGTHDLAFTAVDPFGETFKTEAQVVLPRPLYLNKGLWAGLAGVLCVAGMVAFVRHRSRQQRARLRHFNPYIAGSPVRVQGMFYGRDGLVERIQGLVHKNSFMIHGARRIGKTSLLLQLKNNLAALESAEYRFFPAFIDLQGVREDDLFHHLMAELLVAGSDWGLPLEELGFKESDKEYQARQFSKDLKRIITFLQEKHPQHVQVVLLMDEVDVLNEFTEKTNQKLRGIFMKDFAEHLSCVMAGIHLKKEWDSAGSPWYNFFEQIPVDAFAPEDARRLILDPVKGIFSYDKDAVDLILGDTSYHPYLIQKVCVSLIGEKLKAGHFRVTKADAQAALTKLNEEIQRNRNELHHQSMGPG